ncbi:MAG TPA: cytochrome c oxidase subunit 3 family protein [Blastocatellia bacterium]
MSETHTALAHQFDTAEQQREAGTLGMWVFLATEILFFGGMFAAYTIYRSKYPDVFGLASRSLDIKWGTINTGVLICSSLTMAMAVYCSSVAGKQKWIVPFLLFTIILGLAFLGIKSIEYYAKYVEHHIPGQAGFHLEGTDAQTAQIFFVLYFGMTGLHALHMIIGIGIVSTIAVMAYRGKFSPEYNNPVEISGLYWHFVDIVWIFLYPLLYLIDRHMEH